MGLFSKIKKIHKSVKKAGDPLKLTSAHKKSRPSVKPDVVSVKPLAQRRTGSQPLSGNKPIPMPKQPGPGGAKPMPKPTLGNKPAPTHSTGTQRRGLGSGRSRMRRK